MARFDELARCKQRPPQTPEQVRACNHVRAVFGWSADSIRSLGSSIRGQGPYAVRVRDGLVDSLEFIYAEGLLIGMWPK